MDAIWFQWRVIPRLAGSIRSWNRSSQATNRRGKTRVVCREERAILDHKYNIRGEERTVVGHVNLEPDFEWRIVASGDSFEVKHGVIAVSNDPFVITNDWRFGT